MLVVALAAVVGSMLVGCRAEYMTPGGPANFRAMGITAAEAEAMTDASIAERMNRKPAASFPASIAIVRLQDRGYRSYSLAESDTYGYGDVTVISRRDVENDVDMATLRALPGIRELGMMNRMVVPTSVRKAIDLRNAAADMRADILFVYTFDTRFGRETKVPFLGTITLGLFPAEQAQVSTTVSGAFIDTRTGYVYGLVEASDQEKQIANLWTSKDAIDQSRRRAESDAFKQMVQQAMEAWKRIVETYGPAKTT